MKRQERAPVAWGSLKPPPLPGMKATGKLGSKGEETDNLLKPGGFMTGVPAPAWEREVFRENDVHRQSHSWVGPLLRAQTPQWVQRQFSHNNVRPAKESTLKGKKTRTPTRQKVLKFHDEVETKSGGEEEDAIDPVLYTNWASLRIPGVQPLRSLAPLSKEALKAHLGTKSKRVLKANLLERSGLQTVKENG